MFEQFQVVVVGCSKGCSTAVLLLSEHPASLCSLQLLPQHPPHCAVLLHAVLQAQYSCNMMTTMFLTRNTSVINVSHNT